MKILIFTESQVGEGHIQAAKAMKQVFKKQYGDSVSVHLVSGLQTIHPKLQMLTVKGYFTMLHYTPWLWGALYKRVQRCSPVQTYFFAQKLEQFITQEKPTIILCTHPTCIQALCKLKQERKASFWLAGVFTDYGAHPFFINQGVDAYFVPHRTVKELLINRYGLPASVIFDFGIPLHAQFEREHNDHSPDVAPDAQKVTNIVIMGGATGYGPLEEIIRSFQGFPYPYRLTVVTGRNTALYQRLQHYGDSGIHVRVLGYVNPLSALMRQADLMISKPGGLTVAESIACETPLIVVSPIPGQEEHNVEFLEMHHAARVVREMAQIPRVVQDWIEQESLREVWRNKLRELRKRNAAVLIVSKVMELAQAKEPHLVQ